MNQEEFAASLSQYLDEAACKDLLGGRALAAKLPAAPFGNFFGDDLLTLLYHSTGLCSRTLGETKAMLAMVCDRHAARHLRAQAAVGLGRFVQARHRKTLHAVPGNSPPAEWFRLARELNSVVGALALANVLLAQCDLRVEFDLDTDPLPRLAPSGENGSAPVVSREVAQAWYKGARVSLRHVQRQFTGWGQEDFCCALACIVNYLTLLPTRAIGASMQPVAQRREALAWIKPLWNQLMAVAPTHAEQPEAYRGALVEQQLAVFLRLNDLEQERAMPDAVAGGVSAAVSGMRLTDRTSVVVIRGEIPSASERSDNDYLKRYEVLRKPVGLTPLADLSRLAAIRRILCEEFPWAGEALEVIMSDLIGRKRHGVLRLGLAPVLLVGPPGTGKTRFAQRLSDLLGTPNTVINLAGMSDVKILKGVTRGWASNRPSRMVEFIGQNRIANPLFILDEIDKAGPGYSNGGDPQEALLDLLEPGNARRYQDVFLLTECDLSYCLYIATGNSLCALPAPLLSRLRPVYFPPPGPQHAEVIVRGILVDMERAWDLPAGALTVGPRELAILRGMTPREMRRAMLAMFGRKADASHYTLH
jgi:hypothetical protein